MTKILEINDLKKIAKKKVPKMFYDYVDSGSWTQSTYKSNEEDFSKIKLRQRVGIDISSRKYETKILNTTYNYPFGFSPVGMGGMMYPDGEILAAQVCKENNIPYILSTMSICSIEEIADKVKVPFWFQLYVMKDRSFIEDIIERAQDAKCKALVVTMDLPVLGQRHQDIRNGLSTPPKLTLSHMIQLFKRPGWCFKMLRTKNRTFGNILGHAKGVNNLSSIVEWTSQQFDQGLSWSYLEWIKKIWKGPIIVKGILDEKDAIIAKEIGVEGIIVSNHGGRQLDGTSSSILALEEITNKVGSDLEVYFDGGIRSGQDIAKALSLGAKTAFFGRPYLYGLGADGKRGLNKVIEIFKKELDITMALCGETNSNNLNKENLYNHERQD
mgnify:CR=1 FL=1